MHAQTTHTPTPTPGLCICCPFRWERSSSSLVVTFLGSLLMSLLRPHLLFCQALCVLLSLLWGRPELDDQGPQSRLTFAGSLVSSGTQGPVLFRPWGGHRRTLLKSWKEHCPAGVWGDGWVEVISARVGCLGQGRGQAEDISELSRGPQFPHLYTGRQGQYPAQGPCLAAAALPHTASSSSSSSAKDYENAIKFYSQAIELNPNNAIYYGNRSLAYLRTECYGYALADATRAIELDKKYIKGYYRRAASNMALGKFRAALRDYETVSGPRGGASPTAPGPGDAGEGGLSVRGLGGEEATQHSLTTRSSARCPQVPWPLADRPGSQPCSAFARLVTLGKLPGLSVPSLPLL